MKHDGLCSKHEVTKLISNSVCVTSSTHVVWDGEGSAVGKPRRERGQIMELCFERLLMETILTTFPSQIKNINRNDTVRFTPYMTYMRYKKHPDRLSTFLCSQLFAKPADILPDRSERPLTMFANCLPCHCHLLCLLHMREPLFEGSLHTLAVCQELTVQTHIFNLFKCFLVLNCAAHSLRTYTVNTLRDTLMHCTGHIFHDMNCCFSLFSVKDIATWQSTERAVLLQRKLLPCY